MKRTKILTNKNKVILYKKLTDYLKEVLDEEENYSTFEDLYQEAKRVKSYGNKRYLTPSLITEWLRGLPVGTVYATYDICVMIMGRISNLLGLVAGSDFGQILITDSNKVRMSGIVDGLTADRAYFEAVGGEFRMI